MRSITRALAVVLIATVVVAPPAEAQRRGRTWESLAAEFADLYQKGRYPEATRVGEEALALAALVHGDEDPLVARTLSNLAAAYDELKNYGRAEELMQRCMAIRLKEKEPDPDELGRAYNNLGMVYRHREKYVEAEEAFEQAKDLWGKVHGPESEEMATVLNNQAGLRQDQDDFAGAEPLFEKAVAIMEKRLPDDPRLAIALNNLGQLRKQKRDYPKARALLERSLGLLERKLGPGHPHVKNLLHNLSKLYEEMGLEDEAKKSALRAQGIQ